MRVVIIGAGAIGLLLANRLAQSQTVAIVARPTLAPLLQRQGVLASWGEETAIAQQITVVTEPAELEPSPDLLILSVKSYDTASALPSIVALRPRAVLTIQNGIGNEEQLAEQVGAASILSGIITTPVEVSAPGHVTVTKAGGIGLAPLVPSDLGTRWGEVFRRSGFQVYAYSDYRAMKWSKAVLNLFGNATAAILDMPLADIYADRRLIAVEHELVLEAFRTMARLKIPIVNLPRYPLVALALLMRWLPPFALYPFLRAKIAGGRGGKAPSLQIDLARGHPRSEGEVLYGAVARAAAVAGSAAPVNQALWETLRDIAAGKIDWNLFRHNPDRLLETIARFKEIS